MSAFWSIVVALNLLFMTQRPVEIAVTSRHSTDELTGTAFRSVCYWAICQSIYFW